MSIENAPLHASGLAGVSELLPAGTVAPDFSLHVTPDQTLSLSELRGKPVILAFYPADWSPVCGDQMALYNEVLPEFQKFGAELLGRRPSSTLPVAGGLRAQGGGRAIVWRLSRRRWIFGARSVRHR
jgi:AhpC/TSA family